MKYLINMKSSAFSVKGQGVASACEEQIRLIQEGLSEKFDVVINKWRGADITHYHTINFEYFILIPFAKLTGTAVGYVHFLPETVDDSLKLPFLIRKVFYWYMIRFYKSMDALVTVNPDFIDRLAAHGIDRKKVTYIPNFVDDTYFHPLCAEDRRLLRQKYGIPEEKFTVIGAGQLQTRKGVFDFVETAERLPQVQFIWAGGFSFGRITDGYEKIKPIMEHPPKNLIFTGIIERDQMNEIYNVGDVFFLPSFEELFPMTVLEAMCCQKPVLLRDLPIYRNILTGYCIKEKSVNGFVTEIERLENDKEHYQEAQDASIRGHLFYNKNHVMKMWDEFYSGLIAKREGKTKTKK